MSTTTTLASFETKNHSEMFLDHAKILSKIVYFLAKNSLQPSKYNHLWTTNFLSGPEGGRCAQVWLFSENHNLIISVQDRIVETGAECGPFLSFDIVSPMIVWKIKMMRLLFGF